MYFQSLKKFESAQNVLPSRKEVHQHYLNTPYWQRKRKIVLKKFGGKCFVCGGIATNIHHRTYERLAHEETSDLIALCGFCHNNLHKFITKEGIPLEIGHFEYKKEYRKRQLILQEVGLIDEIKVGPDIITPKKDKKIKVGIPKWVKKQKEFKKKEKSYTRKQRLEYEFIKRRKARLPVT
jgi:hypothetical protein